MARLNPYLSFNGKCKEAFEFYKECLGGELTIQTNGESPMADQIPVEMHNNVLHAMLKSGDMVIMGSDMGGPEAGQAGNVTMCMNEVPKEQLQEYFNKLSEGANITTPLKTEFFGTYGDLIDKFGFRWMFQSDDKA